MPRLKKTPKPRGHQPHKTSRFALPNQDSYEEMTIDETSNFPVESTPVVVKNKNIPSKISFENTSFIQKTPDLLNHTFDVDDNSFSLNMNSSKKPSLLQGVKQMTDKNIPPLEARSIQKRKIISKQQFIEINRRLEQFDIPVTALLRILKGVVTNLGFGTIKFTKTAVKALQVATEDVIREMFHFAFLCSTHRQRVTVTAADFRLVVSLRRDLLPWMSVV
ncbi:hypothetical protein SNEBB_007804 [Seison nebaliae]|nr:hypothetical protein SNEBB_007804 [Seison nebaliae]